MAAGPRLGRWLWLLALLGLLVGAGAIGHALAQEPERSVVVQPAEMMRYPLVAPYVTVGLQRIELIGDYVRIKIPGAHVGRLTGDSNLPVHGEGSVVLYVDAQSADVHVGDFVLFRWCGLPAPALPRMHQVVRVANDAKGWYAMTKGVNQVQDLCPVREADVIGRAVALFW